MKNICEKCGYVSEENLNKFGIFLCKVCFKFSPNIPEELDKYVQEKVDKNCLESFRKFAKINS